MTEEFEEIPKRVWWTLEAAVESRSAGLEVIGDMASAARSVFGGVLAQDRWMVTIGELESVVEVSLEAAVDHLRSLDRLNRAHLSVHRQEGMRDDPAVLWWWSATSVYALFSVVIEDSDVDASTFIEEVARFVMAMDARHELTKIEVRDAWTGGFVIFTVRGVSYPFVPYAWMFVLDDGVIDPGERFAGTEWAWCRLRTGQVLCWWTGGTIEEFWTGSARADQRRLLRDLFPEVTPDIIEHINPAFHRHVLPEDLAVGDE